MSVGRLVASIDFLSLAIEDDPPVGMRRDNSLLGGFLRAIVENDCRWEFPPVLGEPFAVLFLCSFFIFLVDE